MAKKVIKNSDQVRSGGYKELVDFLSVKFDKIDEKFDEINKKLDQKADKSEVKTILERITRIGNKIDDYRAEQIGMQKQLNKHEKWHFKTAAKVGIDLVAE